MASRRVSITCTLALCTVPIGPARAGEDLAKIYPATRTWVEQGLTWVSTADDVWRLSAFELGLGGGLSIEGKKASVVFGRNDTDVLWAVVFPDRPAKIDSDLAGDGEKTSAILVRFNGGDIGRMFPAKTVKGPGPAWLRARAGRIFRRKIGWKWSTPSGNPTIVPRDYFIVDADTDADTRRFYGCNRQNGKVDYVADFETKTVPPLKPIKKKEALEAFDEVWATFDREYAMFVLLPDVDWDALGKEYRKAATDVDTAFDLAALIADMLAELQDLHVWVKAGEDWLPGYTRERPLNANWEATRKRFGTWSEDGENLHWGRTDDGIGYLNVHGLSDAELGKRVDRALDSLADTWALVVDLRFNGGGGEDLAREVAGRFLDEPRVYGKNRYRAGPKHDQLGSMLERSFQPRGPWRYQSPVVCLQGRRTMSSAESMALMMAQCPQVTTMGAPTAGSSGNPRRIELDCGITVNMPRWIDYDPGGNPIERVGVAPGAEVSGAEFSATSDPVIEAALERLRATPEQDRLPGKRD